MLLELLFQLWFFRNLQILGSESPFSSVIKHQAAVCEDTMSIRDDLEKEIISLFQNDLHSLPIHMSKDDGNIQVRVKWDGDHMLTFCEAKQTDIHPSKFRDYLTNFSTEFPKVNPMAQEIVDLEQKEDRIGVKTFLKFPFPLSNRIMVHWRYLKLDRHPDEHLLWMSERGNEEMLQKHLTKAERKKYILARTFLCAYWIKPVRSENKVVGSQIMYIFSGDTGGNIPSFIQSAVGPKSAVDSVHGLIKYLEKK